MFHAFSDTNFSTGQVFESSDGEWKSWVFLVDDREESSSVLRFKGILYVHLSLVDHSSCFNFFTHTFTGGSENLKTDDITWSEFPVFNSLFWSFFIDNDLVSVNQMFLGFMGKNTLNWFNSISFTNFSNVFGNILIGGSNLDGSNSSEESVVGSKNDISLFTVRFSTNDDGVSGLGSISVNLSP